MKRLSFRNRIIIINSFAFILVIVTAVFAYQRFTGIIAQINDDRRPDSSLQAVKSLLNDIKEAENHVKSFTITKDTLYLNKYYSMVYDSQLKWDHLESVIMISVADRELRDSLGKLVIGKFDILNELLVLQDEFRAQVALDKVVHNIESSFIEQATEPVEVAKKKRGFLSRLFKRKKEVDEQKMEEIKKDISNENVTVLKINREIDEVKKEENAIADSIRRKELELILADKNISDNIRSVVGEMEVRDEMKQEKHADQAQKALEKTNFQIALFCIVTGILLIIMMYTLTKYITYNNRYRRALKKAKAETEDLASTKAKFFTNMSHEIRTPLNSIVGFADLIGEGPLSKSQSEQLKMLQKSADHMMYLINDVLDLARLDAGKLRLEATGFYKSQLFKEVKALLQPVAVENETELVLLDDVENEEADDILVGDPYRLKQILLNIIGNAIKFTKNGMVTVKTTSEGDDREILLKIEVFDTGIGMSRKQLDKVFLEFEQANIAISRTYGGSGLGLSIVYRLIKLHGGKVEIQSTQGKGTSVFIEIPYKKGTKANIVEAKEDAVSFIGLPQNLKVLVVDDEEYNRKLLLAILSKYNSQCVEAENGHEALKELKKNNYDLVLMDSRMPKMSGVEATRKIRKMSGETKDIPIIALTAAISEIDQREYVRAGMQGFLPKPFKERELIKSINLALNHTEESYKNDLVAVKMVKKTSLNGHLDLTELYNLSRGDSDFFKEMLRMFMESTTDGLAKIKENLEKLNWKAAGDHAHKISAPCRHIGANDLLILLKTIEENCRTLKETEALINIYHKAKVEYEIVEKAIKEELKNNVSGYVK